MKSLNASRFTPRLRLAALAAALLAGKLALIAPFAIAQQEPPPSMSPALGSPEAEDDATPEAMAASLTPILPPEAATPEVLAALVAQVHGAAGEAGMEKLVRAHWPQAQVQPLKLNYRDIKRFEITIENSSGLASPSVFPFYFSAVPGGAGLKLKFLQFLGAGEVADFPDRDKAAASLGVVVLPEKMKAKEAQEKVFALIERAEAQGLAALCIAGLSEYPDFDFSLITTSARLPGPAETEIANATVMRRFPGQAQYIAGKQAGLRFPERKLVVAYSDLAPWKRFTEDPRLKKTVKPTKLLIQAAVDNGALSGASFVLKVPGSDPARAAEWVQLAAEWDGMAPAGQTRPGATRAASVAGLLLLGNYFLQHPAPRPLLITLYGGGGWGSAGAAQIIDGFTAADSIKWALAINALGRFEDLASTAGTATPLNTLFLTGWSRSKSIKDIWSSITGSKENPKAFYAVLDQYDLKAAWADRSKDDRDLTELNGLYGALLRRRMGTPLGILGANPSYINQAGDTPDKLNYVLLALQVRATGHFAQKLASPA